MNTPELGQFSISLTVKNLEESLNFYKLLGFDVIDGGHINDGFPDSENSKWRILQSPSAVVGLFQGMFPNNIMTFNPKDVRGIQKHLKSNGITLQSEADETTEGPASIMFQDPDGNQILIDQH